MLDFGNGSSHSTDNQANTHTKVGAESVTGNTASDIVDLEKVIDNDGVEGVSNHLKDNNDKFFKEPNSAKDNSKDNIHDSATVNGKSIILLPDVDGPFSPIGIAAIKQFLAK